MAVRVGEVEVAGKFLDEMSGPAERSLGGISKKAAVVGGVIAAVGIKAGADWNEAKRQIVQSTGASGEALEGLMGVHQNLRGSVVADNAEIAMTVGDLNTQFDLEGDALESLSAKVLKAKRAYGEFDINELAQQTSLPWRFS